MAGCFYHKHTSKHKRKTKSLEDLVNQISPPPSPVIAAETKIARSSNSESSCTDGEKSHHKFHFFHRQRSYDTTDMTLITSNRFPRLNKLFRSRSEQGLKSDSPGVSPAASPKSPRSGGHSAQPRRRLLRVVRDNQSEGEEWENPHVVRRYSKSYWEKQMAEAQKLQHSTSVPYDVNSEQSILKKTHYSSNSTDSDTEMTQTNNNTENSTAENGTKTDDNNGTSSPTTDKHLSFNDDVEVVEFIGKEKITKQVFYKHEAKLIDSDSEELISEETTTTTTDTTTVSTVESTSETTVSVKSMLKKERVNEFSHARESLDSIGDEEDDDDDVACYENHTMMSSDTGTTSDASQCSDSDEPRKKQKKKRSHLHMVKQKISKRLLGLHLQEEVDMTDSDSDSAKLELIPEQ